MNGRPLAEFELRMRGKVGQPGLGTVFGWTLALALFSGGLLASSPAAKAGGGLTHQHYVVREEHWSIQVVRIDRKRPDLKLVTALGGGDQLGLSTMTDQLRLIPKEIGRPVAALNGDFYRTDGRYEGDPRGLQILNGELVSSPGESTSFWIDAKGHPQMDEVISKFAITWPNGKQERFGLNEDRGRDASLYTPAMGRSTQTPSGVEFVLEAVDRSKWLPLEVCETIPARIREIRRSGNSRIPPGSMVLSLRSSSGNSGATSAVVGDVIAISTETVPNLRGVKTAIGGGPALVSGSRVQPIRVARSRERHPRSAVGWNKDEIFFVQVDGRQRHSSGITLPELAEFMARLKCEEAMNLDGGGSSEIWMNGRILNRPCYGHERSTANVLVVVKKDVEDES